MSVQYQIILSHEETIEASFAEAYSAYKAVCQRNKLSCIPWEEFIRHEKIEVDSLIFKKTNISLELNIGV